MQIPPFVSDAIGARPGKRTSSDSSLSFSLSFDFTTHLTRNVRGARENCVSLPAWLLRSVEVGGTSKLVQSYHEGRHVRDDLIIRDCSSAVSGGAAGAACRRGGAE